MTLFNPIDHQRTWFDFMAEFVKNTPFGEPETKNNGDMAQGNLKDTVFGILANLDNEVAYLPARSLKWVSYAIHIDEKSWDPDNNYAFYKMLMQQTKAMASWLKEIDGSEAINDVDAWKLAVNYNYLDSYPSINMMLEYSLLNLYLAEEFVEGIALYESYKPNSNIKKPNPTPADALYANCKYRSDGSYTLDEVIAISEKAMRRKMQEHWLGRGLAFHAAMMLKATYWDTGVTKTVKETLMKAYDLMPKVDEPPVPNPDDFKPKPKKPAFTGIKMNFKM